MHLFSIGLTTVMQFLQVSKKSLRQLQLIQNAARFLTKTKKTKKREHIASVLRSLY